MNRFAIAAAWRPVFVVLSPSGSRARLSILIYHRVLPEADPMRPGEPDAERFEWQMELVASLFRVLPLGEAIDRLRGGTLPARTACITFDDGYADNHQVALPVLRRVGLPATFFIATGFLNGGTMFNDVVIEVLRHAPTGELDLSSLGLGCHRIASTADRLSAVHAVLREVKYSSLAERRGLINELASQHPIELPRDLMMRDGQVSDLVKHGMAVGAHTVNHPILRRESVDDVTREIEQSRSRLETLTGQTVRLFAYPNGRLGDDFSKAHRDLVERLGFDGAVTTHPGVATRQTDGYMLPRLTPWDRTAGRFAARMALNLRSAVGQA